MNLNTILKKLEDDIQSATYQNCQFECQIVKSSVVDVLKKYFALVTEQEGYYNRASTHSSLKKRILNMALTTDHITEAHHILQDIQSLVKQLALLKDDQVKIKPIYDKIVELNNAYYSLIPSPDFSYTAVTELINDHSVKREIEKLTEIYDFGRAFKLSIASLNQKNPLQYIQDNLPIKIKRLSEPGDNLHPETPQQQEFAMIMRYINASLLNRSDDTETNFVVSNIYQVSDTEAHLDEQDKKVFNEVHNHWMLWHGTKKENLMSIMLKGLQIKPPNANHTGSLFGDAIYFADSFTKSLNYSRNSYKKSKKGDNTFYLMLCEVALGNIANYSQNWTIDTYRPPQNYHSVRMMSSKGPDFAHSVLSPKMQVWPIGPVIDYPKAQVEKGVKRYTKSERFYADWLKKKEDSTKKKATSGRGMLKPQYANKHKNGEESEDLEIDEDEKAPTEAIKKLEDSFLNIKERKYEIEPNLINADYCMSRLRKDAEDFDLDGVYGQNAEYMVYSEKQVRIRYLVELKHV